MINKKLNLKKSYTKFVFILCFNGKKLILIKDLNFAMIMKSEPYYYLVRSVFCLYYNRN